MVDARSQDLRDQVVRDTEAARHTLLQKDAEIRELRDRLDVLVHTFLREPLSPLLIDLGRLRIYTNLARLKVWLRLPRSTSKDAVRISIGN